MADQEQFSSDVIDTAEGGLKITFIGHGTLMLTYSNKYIHVDPYGKLADYAQLPDADLVLITHGHRDHFDEGALNQIRTDETKVIAPEGVADQVQDAIEMQNGSVRTVEGIKIEAVPAYNIAHKRDSGEPYHPKGEGNGYILTFADTRVYIAGDTENVPEMKDLEDIDVAFLPMNLPYTMTPEMVADAVRVFHPTIVYPYHFGDTEPQRLVDLLSGEEYIDVRVRDLA